MTAVRPDDTAGTGERSWFHEYGFEGDFDFDAVLEFATAHGFVFVYGGCTRDDVWVGYPAECDRLVAAVREAEAQRTRLEGFCERYDAWMLKAAQAAGYERDDWGGRDPGHVAVAAVESQADALREAQAQRDELRAHVESQDWHTEFYAPLKRRAVNAEARAAKWPEELHAQYLAMVDERDEAVARAERAEGLHRIALEAVETWERRFVGECDRADTLAARLAAVSGEAPTAKKATDLLPCYCHGDDLVPYCPRHTPLPGEAPNDE